MNALLAKASHMVKQVVHHLRGRNGKVIYICLGNNMVLFFYIEKEGSAWWEIFQIEEGDSCGGQAKKTKVHYGAFWQSRAVTPRCHGAQSCWSSCLSSELRESSRSRQSRQMASGGLRMVPVDLMHHREPVAKRVCVQTGCCPWSTQLSRRQLGHDQHPQILKETSLNNVCGEKLCLKLFSSDKSIPRIADRQASICSFSSRTGTHLYLETLLSSSYLQGVDTHLQHPRTLVKSPYPPPPK